MISGFGTFKVNDRKARKGISPKTQEEMIIPASKTVTFKPSNRLKRCDELTHLFHFLFIKGVYTISRGE